MKMGVVFAKTRKGHDEIASRSGGLTPRERRVLIFADGKRSIDELQRMLQSEDLKPTLDMLQHAGLIEAVSPHGKTGAQPATAALPTITVFRPLPEPLNTKELELARNYLINSLKTFCSPHAHQAIIEAARTATTHEELRWQFDPWLNAIIQTPQGRLRAEELRNQLLKII
jgi:hypothetical protein